MLLILDSTSNSDSSYTLGISLHAALGATRAVERVVIEHGLLLDGTSLARILNGYEFHTIINCTEFSDIDRAEYEREAAYCVNGFAVGAMAEVCRERDALLVHLSTSSVFSGCAGAPVREEDIHDPLNVFGDSRSLGEMLVASTRCRHLTVRLPYVYGGGIPLFNHGLAMMSGHGVLAVHGGQVIAPMRAAEASTAVSALLDRGATGTFHIGPRDSATARDFAARALNLLLETGKIAEKTEITEVGGEDFLAPADRPLYNVLDTKKYSSFTGLMSSGWEAALEEYIGNHHGPVQVTGKEHVQ